MVDRMAMKQGIEPIEVIIGRLFRKRGWRLSIAESCTGGLIGHRITNVPGSSDYFDGGVITYSNDAKIELLKVPEETIATYGAVSRQTAVAMAEGIRKLRGIEVGIGVTGIAGPAGGTEAKPVGLVYIALSLPVRVVSMLLRHPELVSGSQTVPGKEIPKQVRNDKLERDFRVNPYATVWIKA